MRITKITQRIELLATKNKIIFFLVLLYYKLLVKRETVLADIKKDDRVLCIGGGVCPYTAILLNQYTKAKVTVIDNDNGCIEKSQYFLHNLGLDDIAVAHSDGACVNCDDYTVIHVAMQVTPKDAVMKQILNAAQEGARVLVRMPKATVENQYSNLSSKFGFKEYVKHSLFSNVHNTSVCVVNREPEPMGCNYGMAS